MILQFSSLSLNFDLPHNFNVEGVQSQVLQLNHIHGGPGEHSLLEVILAVHLPLHRKKEVFKSTSDEIRQKMI